MNHVIKIRNRHITVDNPSLFKGSRNTDTITLDTDEEWDGKTITVYVGNDDHKVKAVYYSEQANHAFRVKAGKQ